MRNLPPELQKLKNSGFDVVDLGGGRYKAEKMEDGDWHEPESDLIYFNDDISVDEVHIEDQATISEFLDAAIYNTEFHSDRELARAVGVSHSSLNNWRRGIAFPTDKHMEKICEFACADLWYGLLMLNYWRSRSPKLKAVYKRIIDGIFHLTGQHSDSDFDDFLHKAKNGVIKVGKTAAALAVVSFFSALSTDEANALNAPLSAASDDAGRPFGDVNATRTNRHADLTFYKLCAKRIGNDTGASP